MTRPGRGRLLTWTAFALILGSLGCAARSARVTPLAVGRPEPLGLVAGQFTPRVVYHVPPAGRGAGAVRGAAAGFAGALGSGNLFLLLGAPIVAGITAVEGAITARPAEEVEQAETTLKRAFADLPLHADLRARIERLAQARTGRALVSIAEAGPTDAEERPDYRPLAERGIATVVEVSVPVVGFRPVGSVVGNPSLQLVTVGRLRLVSVADGGELARRAFTYQGGTYKFAEWAAGDAERFRAEIERATEQLAWTLVKALFCADPSAAACEG